MNEDIINKQIDRLLERYDTKIKYFNIIFIGLIGFAIIFFLSFFLPYFIYELDIENWKELLKDLSNKTTELYNLNKTLSVTKNELVNLTKQIKNDTNKLELSIGSFPSSLEWEKLKLQPNQVSTIECNNIEKYELWLICSTTDKVSSLIQKWNTTLKYIESISKSSVDIRSLIEILNKLSSSVKEDYLRLESNINSSLSKNLIESNINSSLSKSGLSVQNIITNYKAKIFVVTQKIASEFNHTASSIIDQIDPMITNVDNRFSIVNNAKKQYELLLNSSGVLITRLTEEEQKLLNTVHEIQTEYFGTFTFRMNDLFTSFPLILGIAFYVYTSLFNQIVRLRRSFHYLSTKKDPTRDILNNEQINLAAPLWIDPINKEQNKIIQIIIFIIPFLIFLLSFAMILYLLWVIDNPYSPGEYNIIIDGPLYILSFGLFILSLRSLKKNLNMNQL